MNISKFKKLIGRYYRQKATEAERYIIDNWYESFDQDEIDLSWLEDKEHLEGIENAIISKALNESRPIGLSRRSWILIAASIFLVATVASFAYLMFGRDPGHSDAGIASKTFITGPRQLKQIILGDSTEIFLNANSSLEITKDFGKKERLVNLSGEAYFKVRQNRLHPFIVRTSQLYVKVLGTSFNINSYNTESGNIKVAVSTGKVQISDEDKPLATLQAKEQVVYHKATKTFEQSRVASDHFDSWTSGTVMLDEASFDELAQATYNLYGVKLRSNDKQVLQNAYNITLRHTTALKLAMEQLCTMIHKNYRREGKEHIIIY